MSTSSRALDEQGALLGVEAFEATVAAGYRDALAAARLRRGGTDRRGRHRLVRGRPDPAPAHPRRSGGRGRPTDKTANVAAGVKSDTPDAIAAARAVQSGRSDRKSEAKQRAGNVEEPCGSSGGSRRASGVKFRGPGLNQMQASTPPHRSRTDACLAEALRHLRRVPEMPKNRTHRRLPARARPRRHHHHQVHPAAAGPPRPGPRGRDQRHRRHPRRARR